jgi:hypothetical protein
MSFLHLLPPTTASNIQEGPVLPSGSPILKMS